MSKPVAIVTGAGGEMGHLLLPHLMKQGFDVAAVDLALPAASLLEGCLETLEASILDIDTMAGLFERCRPTHIFHLAAVLSAKAERDPALAHQVNVEGTLGLFRLCQQMASDRPSPIRFLFPSSIAAYGLPDATAKHEAGALKEWEWNTPSGMYGCNKLYCELFGDHITRNTPTALDFRSIRFPGLLSTETLPTGGTTDYAPEMVHAAVQSKRYTCFVEERTRLPFMTMPDAVTALVTLAGVERSRLSRSVYNIKGFSASAGEIRLEILKHFPDAQIDFDAIAAKQELVDGWPADVDDQLARRDWGLKPQYDFSGAIAEYLFPALRKRYGNA